MVKLYLANAALVLATDSSPRRSLTTAITQSNIQTAVNLWISDRASCMGTYGHISDWDTSQVTSMANLFKDKGTFNDDISKWDTSKVTSMQNMFREAYAFNQPIGNWDVSKVQKMQSMFYDEDGWRRSKIEFNQDIGNWDVSGLSGGDAITYIFYGANFFEQDLTGWAFPEEVSMYYLADQVKLMPRTSRNWPCRHQTAQYGGAMADCQCPASKSLDVATQTCLPPPTPAPTHAPTEMPTPTPTPPTNSPTNSPTITPTLAPTRSPTRSPTTEFAGQYKTGSVSENAGNLATNAEAGDATAIALVSVSLVFILLLMCVAIFLVIKVKQLADTIKGQGQSGAGSPQIPPGALTKKQQTKNIV